MTQIYLLNRYCLFSQLSGLSCQPCNPGLHGSNPISGSKLFLPLPLLLLPLLLLLLWTAVGGGGAGAGGNRTGCGQSQKFPLFFFNCMWRHLLVFKNSLQLLICIPFNLFSCNFSVIYMNPSAKPCQLEEGNLYNSIWLTCQVQNQAGLYDRKLAVSSLQYLYCELICAPFLKHLFLFYCNTLIWTTLHHFYSFLIPFFIHTYWQLTM